MTGAQIFIIFGYIGMSISGVLVMLAIITATNFLCTTSTRKEIRERKRLKRQTTDHYAAVLEHALYGKVLTGGSLHCNHKNFIHPEVEPLYEETGKLPVPVGYGWDNVTQNDPFARKIDKHYDATLTNRAITVCGACNGVDHHWSWCPVAIARREAKPRYRMAFSETLEEQVTRVTAENDSILKRFEEQVTHMSDTIHHLSPHDDCYLCDHPELP
jgi:hypothetical protein